MDSRTHHQSTRGNVSRDGSNLQGQNGQPLWSLFHIFVIKKVTLTADLAAVSLAIYAFIGADHVGAFVGSDHQAFRCSLQNFSHVWSLYFAIKAAPRPPGQCLYIVPTDSLCFFAT